MAVLSQPVGARGPANTAVTPRQVPAVAIWAFFGGLMLLFEAWVVVRWMTGPYFKAVPSGVTPVPTIMKVELTIWEVISWPAAAGLVWYFVVRPWRRTHSVGINGALVLAFCTVWWQDPMSDAEGYWFTYNSWMFNRGSWAASLPGWHSAAKPGAMLVEPLGFTPPAYVYIFTIAMFVANAIMRRARKRWPAMSNVALIGVCFAGMYVFDLILEGVLWLPMGVFEYEGGHWGINSSTYFKYPLHEGLTIGAVFTVVGCLKFFVDDRGQGIFERGSSELKSRGLRQLVVRGLAAAMAVQLGMLVFYTIPNLWVGAHSTAWPKSDQEKSYFLNGLCGEGTDRACPGPGVPVSGNGDLYVRPDGTIGNPGNVTIPAVVPLKR